MLGSNTIYDGKRKADESNPLLNAAKRAKKEVLSSQPGKRKADSSNPLLNNAAAKRPRKEVLVFTYTNNDSEAEQDVRAMEDEADHLRRNSRAHTTMVGMGMTDVSIPLPENETPQLKRNKELRQGAMAAIVNGQNDTRHHRKSSVNVRGKRISSSFEATGVLYQPHNSVSDDSFYKHIDVDLPDSERIRQLLIWSSLRAAATPIASTSKSPSSSTQPSLTPAPLPPLSAQAVQVLKRVQEDIVKMLAEKRIDLSLYDPEAGGSSPAKPKNLLENEQNVRNRQWEVIYSNYIKDADAENEAWKEVGFKYKAMGEKLQASLQERTAAALAKPDQLILPSASLVTLSEEIRRIDEIEAKLSKRFGSTLEFKVDQIYSFISTARATTRIAEKALNQRFDIIASNLKSRLNPHPHPSTDSSSSSGSSTHILTTYITNPQSKATSTGSADSLDLMRALTRVDQERPPGMVGDAALRAVKEVQRVEESGVGAVGERRLTGVSVTPRKMPGTPRRGNTPGRDR